MNQTQLVQVFAISLIIGCFLFGAEIFVPGGILGTVGVLSLFTAVVTGFYAFPEAGPFVAIGVLAAAVAAIIAWIKLFPNSIIGKRMTAQQDLKEAKATEEGLYRLIGMTGEALSGLRPAGFAKIDGRRVDVVTQGGMIDKGCKVKVVEVEGNRVVVQAIQTG